MPQPKHDPDPAEITRECAKIRATWSEGEEQRRRQWAFDREQVEPQESPSRVWFGGGDTQE